MKIPKLSKTQKHTLIMALVKTKQRRRWKHNSNSPTESFCYAIKREIATVRALGRFGLVCIQTGGWNVVYYDLTDAGWLLAQALIEKMVPS